MPRKEDQKNWKYKECFKSNKEGSCNWCKSRFWNEGNKIYALKKDNGKWIACTDKKCYLEQGGKLTLYTTKKEQPTEVSLEDFRWDSIEVEPPEVIADLPGSEDHDLLLLLMGRVSRLEYVIGRMSKK